MPAHVFEATGSGAITASLSRDCAALAGEWRDLQKRAAGSFYQTFEWCSAWLETVGREQGASALIALGRGPDGRLMFLLPFAVRRSQGCRIIEWIGSGQIGYGYGLYDHAFLPQAGDWFGTEGWRLLQATGADLLFLRSQPRHLHGVAHPLTAWFSFTGRNRGYMMSLAGGYEAVYAAKRSSETRRGNRKRDAKLAGLGEIWFGLPESADAAKARLSEMFADQAGRLGEAGIGSVFEAAERRFVSRLADFTAEDGARLLPYHLKVAGRMEAMMLGGSYDGTYWAMISSLGSGPARRYSPGDAALRRTIEACAKAGLRRFDFSSGDTLYKSHWADEIIPLHDTLRGLTAKGYLYAAAGTLALLAKRAVKTTPVLWDLASGLRKLRGRPPA